MQRYQEIQDKTYTFGSCETCGAGCCTGENFSLMSEIVLEEFENCAKNFPILFVLGEKGYIKPVILLTNGKEYCRYINNYKCTIYDKRPSTCKIYPLGIDIFNNIHIDLSCPAVNKVGITIIENKKVHENFDHIKLNDYQQRFLDTHTYFNEMNDKDDLEHILTIKQIKFYKFISDKDKKYINIHTKSLKNLDEYFD